MEAYFGEKKPISGSAGEVVRIIADRYMKENPAVPFAYRAFSENGFVCGSDGRWILDFDEKFPDAEIGDYAYAFAKFYCRQDGMYPLSISCRNPWELYVNGELAEKICQHDENLLDRRRIEVPVKYGFNTVFLKCRKNVLGFRCEFGTNNVRWNPLCFYTAFAENDGEIGWNYCGGFKEDIFAERVPAEHDRMGDMWLPRLYSNGLEERPFSHEEMYAVTTLVCEEDGEVRIHCRAAASMEIYVDGLLVAAVGSAEQVSVKLQLNKGTHAVSVRLMDMEEMLGFQCLVEHGELALPECVKDVRGKWLYLDSKDPRARAGFDPYVLYDGYKRDTKEYYQCARETYIRPVLEQNLYGKSNYPLGVVLYGLLMAADYLQDEAILEYAHKHLKSCYASAEYMIWDKEKFGCPCINHQLALVDTLDDCGSFASTALEDCLKYHKGENILPFADYVGDYILHKQERLDNGMFFRRRPGTLHKNTIWADDLYMSVPFLVRYAALKKDESILDDAVHQFLMFKEKLFMEDRGLMSHVYNLTYDKPTGVPWGRGNGWVLFSLSEMMLVLSKEHEHYEEIRGFFAQLAEGFLDNIGDEGMIHQVVWNQDSYAEASSTAMCAAAFARGVRLGILPEQPYMDTARRCVEALKEYCVDEDGNIYGVCRGSGYSYREEYYMNELPWVKNDTHGTGIVLIALIETARNEIQDELSE